MDSFAATNGDTVSFYRHGCGVVDVTVTGPRGAVKSFVALSKEQANALRWFLVDTKKK